MPGFPYEFRLVSGGTSLAIPVAMTNFETIDLEILGNITGGAGDQPEQPTAAQTAGGYAGACAAGAVRGAAIGGAVGAVTGPGALAGAGLGAVGGCVSGMVMKSTPAY